VSSRAGGGGARRLVPSCGVSYSAVGPTAGARPEFGEERGNRIVTLVLLCSQQNLTGAAASTCRVTAGARVSALPSDGAGELDVAQPVGRGADAER